MMSQMIEGNRKTYTAAAAIGANLRVKITDASTSPPTINVAGATDASIGVTEVAILAAGPAAILLSNAQGTRKMVANAAITGGNKVYAAADGEVAPAGTIVEGIAQETVTADQDILEVLTNSAAAVEVSIEASVESVTADDSESSLNSITAAATAVTVGGVTNDADDFVVLPAIADVPIGHTVNIVAGASSNFELRTPASSGTTINNVDSDGTQEYLVTDTDMVRITKATATGWVAQSITTLGAVRTAVVPD